MSVTRVDTDGPDAFTVTRVSRYVRAGLCPSCGRELWAVEGEGGRYLLLVPESGLVQPHYGGITCAPSLDDVPMFDVTELLDRDR